MSRLRVLGSALARTPLGSLAVAARGGQPREALPPSSLVLSCMLRQAGHPALTAWYVGRGDASDDQWGRSHFNFEVDGVNYHVLRTGAFPFIKYHATRKPKADLAAEDVFYRALKVVHAGVPTLLYGLAGLLWARHTETVILPDDQRATIYFWYPEHRSDGSS
jgi:hypothetical protein